MADPQRHAWSATCYVRYKRPAPPQSHHRVVRNAANAYAASPDETSTGIAALANTDEHSVLGAEKPSG